MKNYKYIGLFLLSLGVISCDVDNQLEEIADPVEPQIALITNGLDFSKFVSVGASFTSGYTDGALFKRAQENSFPNILAGKFGITDFKQPLMKDNIGGFVFGGVTVSSTLQRFYLSPPNPSIPGSRPTPTRLNETPTTNLFARAEGESFQNFGIPGAKSFHFVTPNYGNPQGLTTSPLSANPYFVRMASSPSTTVLGDALAQSPSFFTVVGVGANDVLSYALGGGVGVDQTGNFDASTYGNEDITDPIVFGNVYTSMVSALASNGAKGVLANIPYITSFAHFTTVPHNPLDPNNVNTGEAFIAQVPLLNSIYGAVNQIYAGAGEPERAIVFSTTEANPVVIIDDNVTDLTAAIATTLGGSPTFIPFVESLGLPAAAAPLVAGLLGQQYGKARSATSKDLLLLPSSAVIGQVNTSAIGALVANSGGLLPVNLAGQLSVEGVTLPLSDKWVLTPKEQAAIKTATDSYNTTIVGITNSNPNVALVDFKTVLAEATTGIMFDNNLITTGLISGGLISLDGVHLTGRGYALMANKILAAMDVKFGSNFTSATNGLAKAEDYPTNYSVLFR